PVPHSGPRALRSGPAGLRTLARGTERLGLVLGSAAANVLDLVLRRAPDLAGRVAQTAARLTTARGREEQREAGANERPDHEAAHVDARARFEVRRTAAHLTSVWIIIHDETLPSAVCRLCLKRVFRRSKKNCAPERSPLVNAMTLKTGRSSSLRSASESDAARSPTPSMRSATRRRGCMTCWLASIAWRA